MRQSKRKTILKKSDREQQPCLRNPEFPGCNFLPSDLEKCVPLNYLEVDILIVRHYFFN